LSLAGANWHLPNRLASVAPAEPAEVGHNGPSPSVGERLLMSDESPFDEATATDDSSDEPAPFQALCAAQISMAILADDAVLRSNPFLCFSQCQCVATGNRCRRLDSRFSGQDICNEGPYQT
jgi:hypothetical protein